MAGVFRRAVKSRAKMRLAVEGLAGSGKTMTALRIARGLVGPAGRIVVIDTEYGSASKYADIFAFDVCELDDFDPRNYIMLLQEAAKERYDAAIIDSLSHAWMGKGGALEMVEQARARSKSGNSFTAWKDVTPIQQQLVDAIVRAPLHVVATMRTKTAYVIQEDERGRSAPIKVGTAAIQRDGSDYEFDVVGEIDLRHRMVITKTRCRLLDTKVIDTPGEDLGAMLAGWLNDDGSQGEAATRPAPAPAVAPQPTPAPAPAPTPAPQPTPAAAPVVHGPDPAGPITRATAARLLEAIEATGMTDQQVAAALARRGAQVVAQLTEAAALEMARRLEERLQLLPSNATGTAPADGIPATGPSAPESASNFASSEPAPAPSGAPEPTPAPSAVEQAANELVRDIEAATAAVALRSGSEAEAMVHNAMDTEVEDGSDLPEIADTTRPAAEPAAEKPARKRTRKTDPAPSLEPASTEATA